MRLKCIKLAGFKSFVDPTTINLPKNMNAIVGPNGCGKSNVIDAVRWVMGESSAKHLRGESMADVIFNGSSARKPLGQASIELVFDNADGSLGGEYAGFAEISIKRKVTRDGLSDYFLNGAKCRRKDITDIFLGTGLGPRSYAIIEQGMISRLIEAKPDELRVYIEEAAGISRYKERRKDTEARMRRTRENLERLTDIREELERQLDRLKRQAAAAEKYREFKAQERKLRGEWRAIQWRSMESEAAERAKQVSELELAQEAVITRQRSLDTAIEKQRVAQTELNEQHNEIQGRYYALGEEIARLEQDIKYQKDRKQQLGQDLEQAGRSFADTQRHLQEDETKVTTWRTELARLEPELNQAKGQEEASLQQLHDAEQAMQAWQASWDAFNEEAAVPKRDAEVQQSRIQHLEAGLQRLANRSRQLQQELSSIVDDEARQALEICREQLQALETQSEAEQKTLEAVAGKLQTNRQQVAERSAELDAMRTRLQEQRGRYASLEALQQAALAEDDERVVDWLKARGIVQAPRLATRLKVEAGWERATETVLGRYLEAVCVDDINALGKDLAGFEGRLTLFDPKAATNVAATAGSLLGKVSDAGGLSQLLSRVRVVDSLDQALAERASLADDMSLVTKDGVWVGKSWIMLNPTDEQQSGILARARELEALKQSLEADAKSVAGLESALQAARDGLRELEAGREAAEQQLRQIGRQQGEIRAQASGQEARLEAQARRREGLSRQVTETDAQYQAEASSLESARKQLQAALEAMSANETHREALLTERDRVRATLDESRQRSRHEKDASHQLAVQVQTLRVQQDSVVTGIERMRDRLAALQQQQEQLRASLADSDAPLVGLAAKLDGLLGQRLKVEESLTAARQALNDADHALRELEADRHKVEQELSERRSALEQVRLDSQTLTVRRRNIEDQLMEDSQDLKALLEGLPVEAKEEQWQQDLQKVGQRIQQLGAINLAAIDEYRIQSERKVYLDTQNDDLVEALTTLENAIRKIDRETRARFKDTFDRVNEGLQDLFPKVFGGGKASLELTGDDLLDTGVAIMARPPGKTNASISVLSGGEKALTAIALVFSIFQLNPAPFCMLDEVDAPLDDVNTGRYARMVREMSSRVQFIYITHNKISMELADHLMGVTMQEPGVSRIVSVDVDEAAEMAVA